MSAFYHVWPCKFTSGLISHLTGAAGFGLYGTHRLYTVLQTSRRPDRGSATFETMLLAILSMYCITTSHWELVWPARRYPPGDVLRRTRRREGRRGRTLPALPKHRRHVHTGRIESRDQHRHGDAKQSSRGRVDGGQTYYDVMASVLRVSLAQKKRGGVPHRTLFMTRPPEYPTDMASFSRRLGTEPSFWKLRMRDNETCSTLRGWRSQR